MVLPCKLVRIYESDYYRFGFLMRGDSVASSLPMHLVTFTDLPGLAMVTRLGIGN